MSLTARIRGVVTLPILAHRPLASLQPTLIARRASSRATPLNPVNENIPHSVVQLVNSETRKPDPPTRLEALLAKLDRKTGDYYALVDSRHSPAPLIVLRNRKAEFEKKKAAKASAKVKKPETKIIEVTWSIEPGDLRHKLSKAKSHLEKGDSLEILFKPKPKVPLPDRSHMRSLADSVEEELQAISNEVKKVSKGNATVITVKPSPNGGIGNDKYIPTSHSPNNVQLGLYAAVSCIYASQKRRIETDVMKMLMSDHEVHLVNDNLNEFFVRFYGPEETPFAGGVWKIHVELPEQYPYKSPSIGFMNKIFHPNIDELSGSVCLDVINQTWSPMFDMINIFEVFLPQLLRYPNPSDPLNGEAAALLMREPKNYEAKVKEYVQRFATKEAADAAGGGENQVAEEEEEEDAAMSDVGSLDDDDPMEQ